MADRAITSTGINGGYDVTANQNTINYLKGVMVSGALINRSDVNSLISLWNAFNSHTHGITDAYQLATYGNNGDRNDYYESDTTNGPNLNGDIALLNSGDTVTAAKINQLVNAMSNGADHSHTWSDRTAA